MLRHSRSTRVLWGLAIASLLIGACDSTSPPPEVSNIESRFSEVLVGDSVNFSVEASGAELEFEWSATRGTIEPREAAAKYTAPDSPGEDTVQVHVTGKGGTVVKSLTFTVVTATPTPSPSPTDTPTPTNTSTPTYTPTPTSSPTPTPTATPIPTTPPTPEPPPPNGITCQHPKLTSYVFPQLEDVPGQRAFYGPVTAPEEVFLCQGVGDIVRSEPFAVKIEYHVVEGTDQYGYFGIGTLGGYDAAQFSRICLWAYAKQLAQAFQVRLKDTDDTERGEAVTVPAVNEWSKICVDLQEFSDQGVKLEQLENVNLGFIEANGSATIWVDDFEFTE